MPNGEDRRAPPSLRCGRVLRDSHLNKERAEMCNLACQLDDSLLHSGLVHILMEEEGE